MRRLAFDIETNGLLDELDKLHCLCIKDLDTGEVWSCHDAFGPALHCRPTIGEGLAILADADLILGHNVVKFDIPAIKKVYPTWSTKAKVHDTLIMARVVWPDIAKTDDASYADKRRTYELPRNLRGRYSLQAFGYRLGEYKGDYSGGWETWSEEMQHYCVQDVEVTERLWRKLEETMEDHRRRTNGKAWSGNAIELEHRVQEIIFRQENRGFLFDRVEAMKLVQELAGRRAELHQSLQTLFPPWFKSAGAFTPKRDNKRMGYGAGQTFTKIKLHSFNPSSRFDVADRLIKLRGWTPTEFTNDGHPKIDDAVLSQLDYPEAKALAELFTLDKRLGAIAEGKEAWLKAVKEDGRIHGQVQTAGAVTGRMTHMRPNIAQVPSTKAKYGAECRALFTVPPGKKLVGCDADALELRCLAGYMARYDGGAYIETVLRGKKEEGTDLHSVNCRAIGLDPTKKYSLGAKEWPGREIAKRWFYAYVYGAGDFKLGLILGEAGTKEKTTRRGKASRQKFMKNLPALGALVEGVKARVEKTGGLVAIDGRFLRVRSQYAALNTLLQSAGAIFMKQALVILDTGLSVSNLMHGSDYEFVANVHDEVQIEVSEADAEFVGRYAAESIKQAGEFYGFACPLAGNYVIGSNWKDTH